MANLIAINGSTGRGKSTSLFPVKTDTVEIKGLNPKETYFINVSGKPFPNSTKDYKDGKISEGGNYKITRSPETIEKLIKKIDTEAECKHIKNVVVDDSTYLQLFTFMDKIDTKGYDKFNDIGNAIYKPLKAASECKREDLNIIFIFHPEKDNDSQIKVKTAGKLVDQYLMIEGMFTFVFYANSRRNVLEKRIEYYFETQSDGYTTSKTPIGCFKDFEIPNDMGYVIDCINNFYKI